MNRHRSVQTWVVCVGWMLAALGAQAQGSPYPTMPLHSLPQGLQEKYLQAKPDMTDKSHCAAAFDSHSDGAKMAFRCSIFIKMSAEGERRAMRYCEEMRAERKITAPCKLIVEH